jgi:hypothetical protein
MLAGRPQEAVGNGSPRWMAAAPRKRGHRTRPTGRLTPLRERYGEVAVGDARVKPLAATARRWRELGRCTYVVHVTFVIGMKSIISGGIVIIRGGCGLCG